MNAEDSTVQWVGAPHFSALTLSGDFWEAVTAEKCGAPTHCTVDSSAFIASDVAEAQTISDYCATQDPVSCTEAAMSIGHGEIRLETKVKDLCFHRKFLLNIVFD